MSGGFSAVENKATGQLVLKWDTKDLEIRTRSVELAIQPLIVQITTLVNTKGATTKRKGRSKRAHVLVAAVERATENFVLGGEYIAHENPAIKSEMLAAVDAVKKTGQVMSAAAREFAEDPCASLKRSAMVSAARALLTAVTRLLILADMVDVHLLLKSSQFVEDLLGRLKTVGSEKELMDCIRGFGINAQALSAAAARRQQELRDPRLRDDLASARAMLRKHSTMLLTASKVYVRHPELAAARANRDFAHRQVCEAVTTISAVAQGGPAAGGHPHDGPGELSAALDDFDMRSVMQPQQYSEGKTREALEAKLESIISGAALMADSWCTRDERRDRIVDGCNAVRQALQDLLSEYISNTGKKDMSDNLNTAIVHMGDKTQDLRGHLRQAVGDHVSDSFLDPRIPLIALIQAAKAGNTSEVENAAQVFAEHAKKLIETATLASSISSNEDGVKMVRYAASQLESLYPEVINAARILVVLPKSEAAMHNMDVFRGAWETNVRLMIEAVDDITSIDDFLVVTENHILEDVRRCVFAVEAGDANSLDQNARIIRGRAARLTDVVSAEMSFYESGFGYVERVLEAVQVLRNQVMTNFEGKAEFTVEALSSSPPKAFEKQELIDASSMVYEGVREIRRAVLMNRADNMLDTDAFEGDFSFTDTLSKTSGGDTRNVDEYPEIYGIRTVGEAMKKMTQEDRDRIAEQVATFTTEKINFDKEVSKWDDSGNDIVVLAKHMCLIMMNMTEFTRGRGPLKTSMDIINAAKKISVLGTRLDKVARQIADECPESSTKQDLLAYLQRITLYTHQLNITSKVKADVQSIGGELIVSGLDSATSLIQAAKNLMGGVVLTVKASYVASTKYHRQSTVGRPLVVWKMKAPEMKPLVRPDRPEDFRAILRRGSQRKVNPIQALSEFQSSEDNF